MRVLVVDDSQLMRKVLIGAVKRLGESDIIEASNGKEALCIVLEDPDIGLVIIDSRMPILDGLTTIQAIRAKGLSVPIIMISTEGEQTKVIEAIRAGASDYLVKPFTDRDIQSKLEKYMTADTA